MRIKTFKTTGITRQCKTAIFFPNSIVNLLSLLISLFKLNIYLKVNSTVNITGSYHIIGSFSNTRQPILLLKELMLVRSIG